MKHTALSTVILLFSIILNAQEDRTDELKAGRGKLFDEGNYAMFIQNILVAVSGDANLATKYIGTPSRFPDVNPSHYAYNAICLAVDRGIMKANTMDGAFGMSEKVSGADALLIIREFQNALRMTF